MIHLFCDQLTYSSFKEHISNFHHKKCYGYNLLDHMSFGSPNVTHYVNFMRYHGVFIENT